jgi:hypothetical protein
MLQDAVEEESDHKEAIILQIEGYWCVFAKGTSAVSNC